MVTLLGTRAAARVRALGLATMARLDAESIVDACGVSLDKAKQVHAALELARQVALEERMARGVSLMSPEAGYAFMKPRIAHLDWEELWLLALDGNNNLRGMRRLAKGGMTGLAIATEDILRAALLAGGRGFILCHNHPSNDPTPSAQDLAFTRKVSEAVRPIGIQFLDHIVIARRGYAQCPL